MRVLGVVIAGLLFGSLPSARAEGEPTVRTGTTELSRPLSAASGAAPRPADAPAVGDRPLKMPALPDGYSTHDGGWIRFGYPAATRQRVQPLIADADAFRAELAKSFGHPVLGRVEVRVARTQAEMAALAPEGAPVPSYASGVAYGEIGLLLVTIEPSYPNQRHDLREVFRHELAHIAVYDAAAGHHVPRWFNEGFAVHASGEASMVRLQTLWTATLAHRLLPLPALDRTFPAEPTVTDVAYAEAADVVRFLLRRQDHARFGALFERLRQGQAFDPALSDAYGIDRDELEGEWREDVARRYTFWPIFLSSGVVWLAVLVLFGWAWRRRRTRAHATLQRWAREEAAEDAAASAAQVTEEPAEIAAGATERLHVVLAEAPRRFGPSLVPTRRPGIPKIEHDGRWHTLH